MHALGWLKTVKEILYWFIMNSSKEIQLIVVKNLFTNHLRVLYCGLRPLDQIT